MFDFIDVEMKKASGDFTASADSSSRWVVEGTGVHIYHYPFCCTGVVMAGFGDGGDAYDRDYDIEHSVDGLKKVITRWVEFIQQRHMAGYLKYFISAVTCSTQEIPNSALEQLGFVCAPPVIKPDCDKKLYVWTLQLIPEGS